MRVIGWATMVMALGLAAGCADEQPARRQTSTTPVAEREGSSGDMTAMDPERQSSTERVFARKTTELQQCWSDEYDRTKNRKWETDLNIQVMVGPSGRASAVKVLHASSPNQTVERCVEETVSGWSFPEGRGTMPYARTVHLGAQF